MVGDLRWQWQRLEGLGPRDVLEMLGLRQAVFVLEQTCLYPDIDDLDLVSWHLLARAGSGDLVAYLRLVDPGRRYPEPSIGRVVTSAARRGAGLGRCLMHEGLERTGEVYPGRAVRISAQLHLADFYASLGFRPVGQSYLEDGIPHLEMLRPGDGQG